jgi:acetolactate synthase I/II/III large subunit
MSYTGGDVLLKCLEAQGVKAVFGMPGNQNVAIYDAFHRADGGIPHYLIRHETAATIMANGYARATGEVAAAFTVPGPGASNASTGLLDAMNDCVPVLLVTGGFERPIARRDRTKMFHGLNQEKFFRPICKYYGCPDSIDEIPRVVEEAFTAMFAGRPGPAVIEIAPDVAAETIKKRPKIPAAVSREVDGNVTRNDVLKLAAKVREMRRPVIIVGADCVEAGAGEEVRKLAEMLQAPVVHGRRGTGVLPGDHPLAAGFTRARHTRDLLNQADGAIAVGTRFTQIDTLNWTVKLPKNLVQIDRDKRELGREYPISAGVAGSLSKAIGLLCDELTWMEPEIDPHWPAVMNGLRWFRRTLPEIPILSHIRRALPRNGLISVDVTSTGYNCFDRFPVDSPRSLIYPCHSVTLGFGLPAAIGAKLACPDRPVVALCGDGGFLMGCFELATAVQYQAGVVSVVVKDNCLSAIRGSQEQAFSGRHIDVCMHSPDFAALARSFGAHGVSTNNPDDLPALLAEGFGRREPTVIEVRMEDRVPELISHIPWLHGE